VLLCIDVYAAGTGLDAADQKNSGRLPLRDGGASFSLMTGATDSRKVFATTAVPERDEQGTGCGGVMRPMPRLSPQL